MTTPTNGEIAQTLAGSTDVPDDELYDQLASILSENFQTSIEKNEDYGDFRTAAEFAVELGLSDDPVEANLEKLYSRATEKHTRFGKQALGDGDNCVDEDPLETALDNCNYWLYIAWVCKHGEEYYDTSEGPTTETAADKCDFGGADRNYSRDVLFRIKEEPWWGEVENVLEWLEGYRKLSQGITGEDLIHTMRITGGDVCLEIDFTNDDKRASYATYDPETGNVLYDGPCSPDVNDVSDSFVDTWIDGTHIEVTPVLRENTTFAGAESTEIVDSGGKTAIADGGRR